MKISLTQGLVHVTGTLKGYNREALYHHIAHFGGRLSDERHLHYRSTALLAGARAKEDLITKAIGYNVPVISGKQLERLLDVGEIWLDEDVNRESFETLRPEIDRLLAGRLTRASWFELCECVDACKEDDMARMLDHIERVLDERNVEEHIPGDFDSGELRPLPRTWLGQAINGVTHPKFALCKTVSFSELPIGDGPTAKLFAHDTLSHIERFDLGDRLPSKAWGVNLGEWFYRGLGQSTSFGQLHTLVLHHSRDMHEMLRSRHLTHVREVHMRPYPDRIYNYDPASVYVEVLYASWASQLETLGVSMPYHIPLIAGKIDRLPALAHISIQLDEPHRKTTLEECIEHLPTILPRLSRVSLTLHTDSSRIRRAVIKALFETIRTHALDLFDVRGCFDTLEAWQHDAPWLEKQLRLDAPNVHVRDVASKPPGAP